MSDLEKLKHENEQLKKELAEVQKLAQNLEVSPRHCHLARADPVRPALRRHTRSMPLAIRPRTTASSPL